MSLKGNDVFNDRNRNSVLFSPSGPNSQIHRRSFASQSVHSDSALDSVPSLLNDRDMPNRSVGMRSSAEIDRIIIGCTSKLKSEPRNIRSLYLRGSMLLKRGEYEPSRQDFTYILQIDR